MPGPRERTHAPGGSFVNAAAPAGVGSRGISVEQAAVSATDGRLSVLIDPARTSRDALVALLKRREVTVKPQR